MATLNENTTIGGIEVYPFLQNGGGNSSSILKTLDKCDDYVVKTIGHGLSGLTAEDVDYLVGGDSNYSDLGTLIEDIMQSINNSNVNLILIIYPGGTYYVDNGITLTTDIGNLYLYGLDVDKTIITYNANDPLFTFSDNKVSINNISITSNHNTTSNFIQHTSSIEFNNCKINLYNEEDFDFFHFPGSITRNTFSDCEVTLRGSMNTINLLSSTSNLYDNFVTIYNCKFSGSSANGFMWNFNSNSRVDIRNTDVNMQCSSGAGTIFPTWSSLVIINNDFTYDYAYDENGTDVHSYLATIPASHDYCTILNNIHRKSTKTGTILSPGSEDNLINSDVYDFNIIATD